MRQPVIRILLFFLCAAFFSCTSRPAFPEKPVQAKEDEQAGKPDPVTPDNPLACQILSEMTLEEKIGQLFIIDLRRPECGSAYQEVNSHIVSVFDRFKPGGIIMFGGNLRSPSQTRRFINDLQNISTIPLFISIDEEGGRISRLNHSKQMFFERMPAAFDIGNTGEVNNAFQSGQEIGYRLRSLGFNMNNAPVADILTNPANTIIGSRSFGQSPDIVEQMVPAFIQGQHSQQIISVMKHYPGHGDSYIDSHLDRVVLPHSLQRLFQMELRPFKKGIENGARAIMTGHLTLPLIDERPATLSSLLINELLRGTLSFDGLVISDAMNMQAISRFWRSGPAAVKAVIAGVDIILMPENLELAYTALLKAVQDGRIDEKRIDQSVSRILMLKEDFGILQKKIANQETGIVQLFQ